MTACGATLRLSLLIGLSFNGACASGERTVADPIAEIPVQQQRAVDRSEFGFRWPFTVGEGTVGCVSGAVVFRNAGRSYAVNEAATARRFAPIDPIRQVQGSGPPHNPLGRLRQDERMRIFAEAVACEDRGASSVTADRARCTGRVRDSHRLTDDELKQIDAEGRERLWPPLVPQRISLGALTDAGLKLCRP